MLPLPYSPNKGLGLFAAFLGRLDARLSPVTRTRVVQGRRETYQVRPKAISPGAEATARYLIKQAIYAVEEARRVPLLQPAPDAAPTPPPVATNCEALARIRRLSARAIRDHLKQLRAIGLITAKRFRGTKANFELWISTRFLWKTAPEGEQGQIGTPGYKTAPAADRPAGGTKLPLIEALEKQATQEIAIGPVEKNAAEPAGVFTGNQGPQAEAEPAAKAAPAPAADPKPATEMIEPGGAAAPDESTPDPQAAARRERVVQFWLYAWKRLYPSCRFSPEEQQQALESIWRGVYGGFSTPWSEADWERYHHDALSRVDLVAAYLQRREEQHRPFVLPMPYAEFVAGKGYFDARNAQGFVGTAAWLQKARHNDFQRRVEKALRRARQELRAHRLRCASRRVMAMTVLQLYRYHESRLAALGQDALRRFYALVSAPVPTT